MREHLRNLKAAYRYATWQILRRAGISRSAFDSSRLEERGTATIVTLPVGQNDVQLRFPRLAHEDLGDVLSDSRVKRFSASPLGSSLTDLVVPYCKIPGSGAAEGGKQAEPPLFKIGASSQIDCAVDLPVSALLTLGCYEDVASPALDEHGRSSADRTLAVAHGYFDRPIVDEWGAELRGLIKALSPEWRPDSRSPSFRLSIDVDHVGLPVARRQSLSSAWSGGLEGLARLSLSWLPNVEPIALNALRGLVRLTMEAGYEPIVYWKAPVQSHWDSGYDLRWRKVKELRNGLECHSVEQGVHPSYLSFAAIGQLDAEVRTLRSALPDKPMGGRQHYLRWKPEMWSDWEKCGLAYDSSVGYSDRIGFRAGTCVPYRPWLLEQGREADLVEVPLIAMDLAVIAAWRRDETSARCEVRKIWSRCRQAGGEFTLLWHNTSFIRERDKNVLLHVLHECRQGDSSSFESTRGDHWWQEPHR